MPPRRGSAPGMGTGSPGALAAAFGSPKPNAAPAAAIPVAVRANWRRDIRFDPECIWRFRHKPKFSGVSFRIMFSPSKFFCALRLRQAATLVFAGDTINVWKVAFMCYVPDRAVYWKE